MDVGAAIGTQDFSYASRVEKRLRELIISGTLPPGERLNESELAALLGVSRGPVREAVQRLRGDGLVTWIPNRGAFVKKLSVDEVRDLYQIRAVLEGLAAGLAADRCQPSIVEELEQLVADARLAMERDPLAPYPSDSDFHNRVVAGAGNHALKLRVNEINLQLKLMRLTSGFEPTRARAALTEHEDVVQAIREGNVPAAEAAMRQHVDSAQEYVLSLLQEELKPSG